MLMHLKNLKAIPRQGDCSKDGRVRLKNPDNEPLKRNPRSERTKYILWWANIGRKDSEETRNKKRISHRKGMHHTQETKDKIRAAMLGKNTAKQSTEHINKRVASCRKRAQDN